MTTTESAGDEESHCVACGTSGGPNGDVMGSVWRDVLLVPSALNQVGEGYMRVGWSFVW